jgi:hypothetical protein
MIWPFKNRRKRYVPPDHPPESLARAREEANKAHEQLKDVQSHDPEVTERSEHLEGVLAENNLGPKFWAAIAARRAH